jgi:hypothetical protein
MIENIKSPVTFKVFRAAGETPWDKIFTAAAEFASTVGAERIVNISHSSDNGSGTVVVWYISET